MALHTHTHTQVCWVSIQFRTTKSCLFRAPVAYALPWWIGFTWENELSRPLRLSIKQRKVPLVTLRFGLALGILVVTGRDSICSLYFCSWTMKNNLVLSGNMVWCITCLHDNYIDERILYFSWRERLLSFWPMWYLQPFQTMVGRLSWDEY